MSATPGVALSVSRVFFFGLLLTVVAILENFGYRQLNNFWRILGTWQFLKGSESWGDMTRKGFKTTSKKA